MTCPVCFARFRLWSRLEAHWQAKHPDVCAFCFYPQDDCQCRAPDWRA